MARHIQSLKIERYRGLNNVSLNGLNDINLIMGSNNSGKTSLLEIISTIHAPNYLGSWRTCARLQPTRNTAKTIFNGFCSMFSPDDVEKRIAYSFLSEDNKEHRICINARIESGHYLTEENRQRMDAIENDSNFGHAENSLMEEATILYLSINVDEAQEEVSLFSIQKRYDFFVPKEEKYYTTRFVSPVDHIYEPTVLKQVLQNKRYYSQLIKLLKNFDDQIVGITALEDDAIGGTVSYYIVSKNHNNALPLSAYGDGMKKAILLLCKLIVAKGGILLIDEFETALHSSVMDSVFAWILDSALKLKVQVFMSTHSKEAIQKVLNIPTLNDSINVYTLYKLENTNLVRSMNCTEALYAMNNLGLELR